MMARDFLFVTCGTGAHLWRVCGGCNAGCELGQYCYCSIPVHKCSACRDCDYGENDEAREIRWQCVERRQLEEIIARDK